MKNSYCFHNVTYLATLDPVNEINFSVKNPEKSLTPEYLYKYYKVSNCAYEHSVDAFLHHYLFASHPSNLNDKYDCSTDLIDYSKLSVDNFVEKLSKQLTIIPEEKVRQLFNSNKRNLINTLSELYQMVMFMKLGIISFTENPDDILMWAYYSENSGFVLKFKTELLPKDSFYGPFPINYAETFEKIDCTEYDNSVCILYHSNVKNVMWKPENEWRYLKYNRNGNYHPIYAHSFENIETRKSVYDPKALEEVILGYDFFSINEIDFNERTTEYDIINIPDGSTPNNWKIKFLDQIVKNALQCSQVIRNREEIKLGIREIKIEKISDFRYKVINPFKNIEIL
jgi:hypothetical protein